MYACLSSEKCPTRHFSMCLAGLYGLTTWLFASLLPLLPLLPLLGIGDSKETDKKTNVIGKGGGVVFTYIPYQSHEVYIILWFIFLKLWVPGTVIASL